MNLNKLFPRLSLRAKLGIAFASLALIPLGLIAAIATTVTITRLRRDAETTLRREVRAARSEVQRTLSRAERDVAFVADAYLAPLLSRRAPPVPVPREAVQEFLEHAPFLLRVKAIAADGEAVFEAGAASVSTEETGGVYYAWRGQGLHSVDPLLIPVEVRALSSVTGSRRAMPVIAIVIRVLDLDGAYAGVVVGEAYASALFAGLEQIPPALSGTTTGLVDAERHVLYHSQQKRTWESLLSVGLDVHLPADSFETGVLYRTVDHLVITDTVRLGATSGALSLFRAVPVREVDRPVREFLLWVGLTGFGLLGLVAALAVVAGRQLSSPIYQLRDAASRLTLGEIPAPLRIETNDELEDFAKDFQAMAETLAGQRHQLQAAVSERTRELRQTHAELEELLEHSADAIVGLDTEGRVRVWNHGAETLFGYSASEALGREADALVLVPGRDHRTEQMFLQRELDRTGAVINFQTLRLTKDGRSIPVSLTQTLLRDEGGTTLGTSLILRDISLQDTLEQHLRRSERLAAMSMMAASLAHEINSPLSIIGNRLECMEDEVRESGHPALLRDLSVLRDHTTRLTQLTQNLLRFARAPAEEQQPVVVADVCRRVGELLEPGLASRNVRLRVLSEGETVVWGVEPALETVLVNLVLNAADAMPKGGTATLEARRAGSTVRLTVTDEGVGVPEELRERIFEPFFTTKGHRGTGLGLPLCRSIVERHGGRIWVEAASRRGSRFVTSIPAAGGSIA